MELKYTNKKGEIFTILIDEEDFKTISDYEWFVVKEDKTNYATTRVFKNGKPASLLLHRLLIGVPGLDVDHINHNGLDNRRENLRACSRSQNLMNKRIETGASSKFVGVFYNKINKNWNAYINAGGKRTRLGCFKNEHDAAKTRDNAALILHGEFATLNFKTA